jgi:hypothetical protein
LSKRYLLFVADAGLSEQDLKSLDKLLRERHDPIKVIPVKANQAAVIVKTSNIVAARLREDSARLKVGGKDLRCILTSGAIGNLKRRASGAAAIGEIPQ